MRLFFIINDLNTGGAEVQLFKLLENLSPEFEPTVISLGVLGPIGIKIQGLGIKVHTLNLKAGSTTLKTFYSLIKFLRMGKPDVIHTWMYHSNLIGGLAAKIAGVKNIIWSIHHNDLSVALNKKSTIFIARLGALTSSFIPAKIVCVSEKVKVTHQNFGYTKDRLSVINNGIDIHEFKYDPAAKQLLTKELNIPAASRIIGLFARYDPIKNIEGFLQAFSALIKNDLFSDIQLIMAGSGINNENEMLTSIIKGLGLNSSIHLLGIRNDIPFLMSSVDTVVNASFNESFSLVLAEAMACEIACISTRGGDPSEILGNCGIIVNAEHPAEMTNALIEILSLSGTARKMMGQMARARVQRFFTINKTVKSYENLYKKLIERNSI